MYIHMPIFKQFSLFAVGKGAGWKSRLKLYYFILMDNFSFR